MPARHAERDAAGGPSVKLDPVSQDHYFSATPSADAPRVTRDVTLRGVDYSVITQGGVFAHDKVDKATAVLLARVPEPDLQPGQIALDLGCGWGPITLALAEAAPVAEVWAVDVNERARSLTKENAERAGLSAQVFSPDEALAALGDRQISLIWSNPPVRIGKDELHELLLLWLGKLDRDGVAYLVIGRNLGADSIHTWLLDQGFGCEKIASAKGFRILRAFPRTELAIAE